MVVEREQAGEGVNRAPPLLRQGERECGDSDGETEVSRRLWQELDLKQNSGPKDKGGFHGVMEDYG